MLRVLMLGVALAATLAPPMSVLAQTQASPPDIAAVSKALNIEALIAVVRDEGLANSVDMAKDLFGGKAGLGPGGAAWQVIVDKIYEPARLRQTFDAALQKSLLGDPAAAAAVVAFFGTSSGQRIIGLEIDARRTLLDDSALEKARMAWGRLQTDKSPRALQIERFVRVNDLIEANVMGALNANLAFYRGMSEAGGFDRPMSEDEMVAEVWGQEAGVRQDSTDWLYPFLTLAYQPLSDAEFDQYIAYSETSAGQKANAAIFAAFDAVFVLVSKELGQSAGRLMAGQDI